MNIHEFSVIPKATQPKTIHWRPLHGVKYQPRIVNPVTWEFLVKNKLNLIQIKLNKYDQGLGL